MQASDEDEAWRQCSAIARAIGNLPVEPADAYIRRMRKTVRWRITRIRGNRADRLGTVEAATPAAAVKAAIKRFQITDPQEQKRLGAMPDE